MIMRMKNKDSREDNIRRGVEAQEAFLGIEFARTLTAMGRKIDKRNLKDMGSRGRFVYNGETSFTDFWYENKRWFGFGSCMTDGKQAKMKVERYYDEPEGKIVLPGDKEFN